MAYPSENVAANVSTLDMTISAMPEAWIGGERANQDLVNSNYLVTFHGLFENGTSGYIPGVYCKDLYAE